MVRAFKKNYGVIFILLMMSIFLWSKIFIAIRKELSPGSISADMVKINFQLSKENSGMERDPQNWTDSLQQIPDPFDFRFSNDKQSVPSKAPEKENLNNTSKPSLLKYYGFIATDSGRVAILEEPTGQISFVHEGQFFKKYKISEVTGEGIILRKGTKNIFITNAQN